MDDSFIRFIVFVPAPYRRYAIYDDISSFDHILDMVFDHNDLVVICLIYVICSHIICSLFDFTPAEQYRLFVVLSNIIYPRYLYYKLVFYNYNDRQYS